MPRSASGVYTLPSGNPVVPGQTIDASWANSTMTDLGTEITNSLSRTGAGGMLAPFRIADGLVTNPGLSFTNETNSGLYRSGAGSVDMSILGVNVAQFSTVGLNIPSSKTLTAQGAAYFVSTLAITGASTMASTLAVTGAITATGGVIGNVTSAGTSNFADVVITGSLDMTAGSAATITGLSTPTNASDAANKGYVDTQDALRLALTGGTMTGAIAMSNTKITGLATPTADQDASTKAYVDSVAQGLDVKGSCRAATTANITLSGAQTIDGVAIIAGDRVLVIYQSTAANNGIYLCASGAWTRTTDADTWIKLTAAFTFIEDGTINDNSGWVCTIPPGGTLGSTAVTFEQFSGAGQITAGQGLTKTGSTINVGTASASRIVVGVNDIDLATTGVAASTYQSMTVDTFGRVTGGTNPTTLAGYNISDAYTQSQVNAALALKLNLTGGTMSGAIAMGASKITNMADPTTAQDAATKNYIDTIFGSTESAAASAETAETQADIATSQAGIATTQASNATTQASNAATTYTDFNNQYLGSKSSEPTVNNTGGALVAGNLYFNNTLNEMRVYSGSAWNTAYIPESAAFAGRGTGVTSTYVSTVSVGGTTFSQPALAGEINSDEGYFSVNYAGATNVTVANLNSNTTYVYIDKTGALQQQTSTPTRGDWSRKIFTMAIAVDITTNLIVGFEYLNNPLGNYANSIRDVYSYLLAQGIPFKKDQTVTGRSADLGFDVGAGTLMEFGGTGDIYNANILSFDAVSNVSYDLNSRTAIVSTETDLVKYWDNNGTITALGSTTVVGHRLFRFSSGNFAIQYGQGNYANMALAQTGALLEDYVLNPALANATFFGWWFIESTAVNTTGSTTAFKEYTIGIGGGVSSGLSGAVLKGNNGSDFTDVPQVLVNLGNRTSATGSEILPAGTTAQRDGSPGAGYLRWNTTESTAEIYTGSAWGSVGGGATGGGSDAVFYENGQTVTTSYSLTAGNNAMSTGPITVNSGVAVTVPSGSRWAII